MQPCDAGFDAARRRRLEGPLPEREIDAAMTNRARIYRHPKTAMQSGMAGCDAWVLDYEPAEARRADPLMGWTGSDDMRSQIRLTFETREAAQAYAEAQGIPYDLEIPTARVKKPKAYADNFRSDRKENWTH